MFVFKQLENTITAAHVSWPPAAAHTGGNPPNAAQILGKEPYSSTHSFISAASLGR